MSASPKLCLLASLARPVSSAPNQQPISQPILTAATAGAQIVVRDIDVVGRTGPDPGLVQIMAWDLIEDIDWRAEVTAGAGSRVGIDLGSRRAQREQRRGQRRRSILLPRERFVVGREGAVMGPRRTGVNGLKIRSAAAE